MGYHLIFYITKDALFAYTHISTKESIKMKAGGMCLRKETISLSFSLFMTIIFFPPTPIKEDSVTKL